MVYRGLVGILVGLALVGSASAQYTIFAAETPAGNLGGNVAAYGELKAYHVATAGGAATVANGLPSTELSDPIGVVGMYGRLYISNRHGNTLGQGSLKTYEWNGTNLTSGVTIATAAQTSHQGFHGFSFSPSSDLFMSTNAGGSRRFRDMGAGYADIDGTNSGSPRDVWVAPDGSAVIESMANGQLLWRPVSGGSMGAPISFQVTGAALHQMAYSGGFLYVTSFGVGLIHKVTLDANFKPIATSDLIVVPNAIGVCFSPDGQEMFVSLHNTTNGIMRYLNNAGTWVPNGSIATGKSMGYVTTVADRTWFKPTSMAVQLGKNSNGATVSALGSAYDGNELQVCRFLVPNSSSPFIRMTVNVDSTGLASLSSAQLVVRARSMTNGSFKLNINAKLAGGSGAVRDSLVVSGFSGANQFYPLTLTAGSGALADYLGGSGKLGCQIEEYQTGPAASSLPCTAIDQVGWSVVP